MTAPPLSEKRRWLLLIHQLPTRPAYLRVKIGRHLQRLGAVAIKSSVYALPSTDQAREDLAWVHREILDGGGEASACEATFFEGITDDQVESLFHAARNADYAALVDEARAVQKGLPRRGDLSEARRAGLEADLARLKKGLSEIAAIDFFGASGRVALDGLVGGLVARLQGAGDDPARSHGPRMRVDDVRARTWVTRRGVRVDRIACAWLIRRFVDPEARFKLVHGNDYTPEPGELRFDMFEAELTHEGDRCSFEVILARFGIVDAGLRAIAEIVHDIDLKDAKFNRPERPGVERLLDGLVAGLADDDARIARGSALLDDLHASFAHPRG